MWSTTPDAASPAAACTTRGTPPTGTRAFGRAWRSLLPLPAAVRIAVTGTGTLMPAAGSGGQDLVEDGLGLLLLGVLRQGELGDEDLACLGEHALLAGGEPAVGVAAGQVADDLGHLDDVAGGELLEVGLVPA